MARTIDEILDDEEGLITEDDAEKIMLRERAEEAALRSEDHRPDCWHVYATDPRKKHKRKQ
jgi:hypothetical protein